MILQRDLKKEDPEFYEFLAENKAVRAYCCKFTKSGMARYRLIDKESKISAAFMWKSNKEITFWGRLDEKWRERCLENLKTFSGS